MTRNLPVLMCDIPTPVDTTTVLFPIEFDHHTKFDFWNATNATLPYIKTYTDLRNMACWYLIIFAIIWHKNVIKSAMYPRIIRRYNRLLAMWYSQIAQTVYYAVCMFACWLIRTQRILRHKTPKYTWLWLYLILGKHIRQDDCAIVLLSNTDMFTKMFSLQSVRWHKFAARLPNDIISS